MPQLLIEMERPGIYSTQFFVKFVCSPVTRIDTDMEIIYPSYSGLKLHSSEKRIRWVYTEEFRCKPELSYRGINIILTETVFEFVDQFRADA